MRNVFKASIRQLTADISDWQRRIIETEALIAQLTERAGIGEGRYSGTRTVPAHDVPPKKRRRRRHKSKDTKGTRSRAAAKIAAVAAPEPVAAKVEPAKAVRGAALYKPQYQELERLALGISEAGDNTEVANKLRVRAYVVGRSMGGKGTYPPFFDRAERMRCQRADAAAKAAEQPETKAPKKRKAPRKPTLPIPPPIVKRTDWHPDPDGSGNLVREIITS